MTTSKTTKLGASDGKGIFALIGQGAQMPAAGARETADGVTRLALGALRLDLAQPRRPLPLAYARRVNAGEFTLDGAVKAWAVDGGVPLDLESPAAAAPGGPAVELITLRQTLARSIFDAGLINPITVIAVKPGVYRIETGERRALAYAYLAACGHADFNAIPARVVDVDHRQLGRRQLDENDQRKSLGAVHRARALWDTRYRLSNQTLDWAALDGVDSLNTILASPKRGTLCEWQQVAEHMRISPGRISQIVSVFDLPAAAVELAEAHGLSEKVLRPLLARAKGDPAEQLRAIQRAVASRVSEGEGGAMSPERASQSGARNRVDAASGASSLRQAKRAFVSLARVLGEKPSQREIATLSRQVLSNTALTRQVLALKPLIDAVALGAEASAKATTRKSKKG